MTEERQKYNREFKQKASQQMIMVELIPLLQRQPKMAQAHKIGLWMFMHGQIIRLAFAILIFAQLMTQREQYAQVFQLCQWRSGGWDMN